MVDTLRKELKKIDADKFPKFDSFSELLNHIEQEITQATLRAIDKEKNK